MLSWFISVQRKPAVWHACCKPQPTPLKTPHLIRICTSVGVFHVKRYQCSGCVHLFGLLCVAADIVERNSPDFVSDYLYNYDDLLADTFIKCKIRLNSALHRLILLTYFSSKVQRKYAKTRLTCFYSRTLCRVAVCWALKANIQMTFCRHSPISSACRVLHSKLYTVPRGALVAKKHWKQSVHVLCKNQK